MNEVNRELSNVSSEFDCPQILRDKALLMGGDGGISTITLK